MRAYELIESSSYIPQNEYEAHDPRWEMALSCDIHPGEDIRQAAKFKFKLGKGGIPPLLRVDGKITESKDKFTKKTDFRFKKGALLMQRVGEINAQKQNHDNSKLPVKRGMWAFPYPAMDLFFAIHKIEPMLPEKLRSNNIMAQYDKISREEYQALWDERDKEISKKKAKIRPKTFWWNKPVYSHIAPKGMQNDGQSWYLWTDLKAWAKEANKSMVARDELHSFGLKPNPNEQGFRTYTVDHLELFLPEKAEITNYGVQDKKVIESSEKIIPIENSNLTFLSTQKKIAWDMLGTTFAGAASNALQKFIMAHPEIEHYLITSQPHDNDLIKNVAWDFHGSLIGLKNFTQIIGSDPQKYGIGIRQLKMRYHKLIDGPYSEFENYVINFKPLVCKDYGISVLVDDDAGWQSGCQKYNIKLIDPMNCIPKQLVPPKGFGSTIVFPKNNPFQTKFTDFTSLDKKK